MLIGVIAGGSAVVAVVVIAKYKASEQQKAVAEQQARSTLARAVKSHYERRRAEEQAAAKKKIAGIEGGYGKRITRAQPGTPSAAELEAEKKMALDKAQAEAAAELAALDHEWHSLAGTSGSGLKMEAAPAAAGSVPPASTRDRESLVASAAAHLPKYLAVAVPPQGVAEEQGGKSTIMLYDTQRQQLVTDDVYVLKKGVRAGKTVKLNGVKAYVASAQ